MVVLLLWALLRSFVPDLAHQPDVARQSDQTAPQSAAFQPATPQPATPQPANCDHAVALLRLAAHTPESALPGAASARAEITAPLVISVPIKASVPPLPDTVLVSKGQSECLIRWQAVDVISAAGNYVELCCHQQSYLLRATMKQVEQRLPRTDFVRIHRCHIVNISAIARISALPGGNGTVSLQNGQVLPLSKGYKQSLRLHKFIPA